MYLTVSGVNITPTVFPGTPIWALSGRNNIFKKTHFYSAHKYIYIAYDRTMNQPNVGTDVHLSTLQCCVDSQVDWVGCLAAVVLVNEH